MQTGEGAARSDWITYMQTCEANYHMAKAFEGGVVEPGKTSRRVKGKPKAPRKARNTTDAPQSRNVFSPERAALDCALV